MDPIVAYLAYSIHGTNCFITSAKSFLSEEALEKWLKEHPQFSRVNARSKRGQGVNSRKLVYTGFNNKDGSPTVSPAKVLRVMYYCQNVHGFKLIPNSAEDFRAKHYPKH